MLVMVRMDSPLPCPKSHHRTIYAIDAAKKVPSIIIFKLEFRPFTFDLGHYITDCPILQANPNDLTRMKRVTGIPKSFLTPVSSSDNKADDTKATPLAKTMISYDGSKVVFTPNTTEWQKFSSIATAAKQAQAEIDDDEPSAD
jgi:hypothetical protein